MSSVIELRTVVTDERAYCCQRGLLSLGPSPKAGVWPHGKGGVTSPEGAGQLQWRRPGGDQHQLPVTLCHSIPVTSQSIWAAPWGQQTKEQLPFGIGNPDTGLRPRNTEGIPLADIPWCRTARETFRLTYETLLLFSGEEAKAWRG